MSTSEVGDDGSADRVWADPESLPGMVQRGRGAGFRRVLERPVEAADVVVDCIVHDPRWDHQVETRSWQYAALVAELGIDLTRLRAAYATPVDPRGDADAWTAVGVLEALAVRGVRGAVGELRHYLRTGRDFGLAFHALLGFADHPEAEGLLAEMSSVADDEELRCAVAAVDRYADFAAPPWPGWRAASARLDRIVAAESARRTGPAVPRRSRAARAHAERTTIVRSAHRIGMIVPDTASDLGERDWEQTLLAVAAPLFDDERTPHRARVALRRQLRDLRTPRARTWGLEHADPGTDVGDAALTVLANNAGPSEAPALFDFLLDAIDRDHLYTQCTLVDGLARADHAVAVPTIARVFDRTVYSYLRTRCAVALSRLAPNLAEEYARECLDDCEPVTRGIGVERVELSNSDARERVRRMVADPTEEPANRRAAANRLAG